MSHVDIPIDDLNPLLLERFSGRFKGIMCDTADLVVLGQLRVLKDMLDN